MDEKGSEAACCASVFSSREVLLLEDSDGIGHLVNQYANERLGDIIIGTSPTHNSTVVNSPKDQISRSVAPDEKGRRMRLSFRVVPPSGMSSTKQHIYT